MSFDRRLRLCSVEEKIDQRLLDAELEKDREKLARKALHKQLPGKGRKLRKRWRRWQKRREPKQGIDLRCV